MKVSVCGPQVHLNIVPLAVWHNVAFREGLVCGTTEILSIYYEEDTVEKQERRVFIVLQELIGLLLVAFTASHSLSTPVHAMAPSKSWEELLATKNTVIRDHRSQPRAYLPPQGFRPLLERTSLYFQGTDNTLWRVNSDGGGTSTGYQTKSTPVVFGGHVYFQGSDDALWQINLDGTGGIRVGASNGVDGGNGYKTSAAPSVAGHIFFRGIDDKLWKVNLDGSGGVVLGANVGNGEGYKTKSTPRVSGRYVYFQGTDDKLWRVNIDGSGGINLGQNTTSAPPFVTDGFVYFRGTDDRLLRCNLDGTSCLAFAGWKTRSTPFVTDTHIYFQGTDDKLWQINLDGSDGVNLRGYRTRSSPVVDTSVNMIYFQGTDNKLWQLSLNNSSLTHLGGFNTASTPGLELQHVATALPRYIVLTLLYAPPGTNGGHSESFVEYSSTSGTGTTLSIGNSFKDGVNVTLQPHDLQGEKKGEFGFSGSATSNDTSSFQVQKSETNDIKVPGPSADGIDHDKDVFYLWLNPQLEISVDPQHNYDWELGVADPEALMRIQRVKVGELKNPNTMDPLLRKELEVIYGLTSADYAQILALDPFSFGATAIDPNRFRLAVHQTFHYLPDSPFQTHTIRNEVTYNTEHKAETSYGVNLSVTVPLYLKYLDLKVDGLLTWTNTNSTASQNGSTQSAIVGIGGPAFGYSGPVNKSSSADYTQIVVYWDTIYNSFMFAFDDTTVRQ